MCMLSGTNKEGRPILWIRSGYHQQGIWRLKAKSPQLFAHLRAQILGVQTAYACLKDSKYPTPAIYLDEGERGALEFNLSFEKNLSYYMSRLFPAQYNVVKMFGVGYASACLFNAWKAFGNFPVLAEWDLMSGQELENVFPFVADKKCIPSYYMDDNESSDCGTEYSEFSSGSTWCAKRIIVGGEPLRVAEVLNRTESLEVEAFYEENCDSESAPLESIAEFEEEEEDDDC